MDFRDKLISEFAKIESEKISRKAIKYFQSLKGDNMQSRDDTNLKNVWDEFCVEVQYDNSLVWDLYVETAKQFINGYVELLPKHANQAIWLQTREGFDWILNNDDEELDFYAYSGDITNYIFHEHFVRAAGRWSNKRIEECIDRLSYRD